MKKMNNEQKRRLRSIGLTDEEIHAAEVVNGPLFDELRAILSTADVELLVGTLAGIMCQMGGSPDECIERACRLVNIASRAKERAI